MNRRIMSLHIPLRPLAGVAGLLVLLTTFSACAGLGLGNAVRSPEVRVVGADLTRAGFEGADLVFQFQVDNPNGIALVLNGLSYRLRLNDRPLLNGRRDDRTEIAAKAGSRIDLPVTIRYEDFLNVVESMGENDRPGYELQADFQFAVPLIGNISVPVTKRGEIPLDRLLQRIGR
jgi:LEA14-like dessication related protein